MPSGQAKLAAVLGWPVKHSLSPKLHNYWLKYYGVNGSYVPLEVRPDELAGIIHSLPEKGFCGCNLTLPHKEAAMLLLDDIDDTAKNIGAINTIVINNGKLHGTNTDAYGFMQNLKDQATFKKNRVVVLGAGGAARAVCHALRSEGFAHIAVVNRSLEKAEKLAAHFGSKFTSAPWEKRGTILEGADLLINTTSLGLAGQPPLDIDLSALPKEAVVADTIYVPLMTPLLEQAKRRGNNIVGGLGMLIHQAVPGFAAWFGKMPEITPELRHHLLEGL